MLSIIAAIAENNAIGKNNKLLWSLPNDLLRFKDITLGGSHTIIMGRRTFEAIGRILPGRTHIILTRDRALKIKNENVKIIHNFEELIPLIEAKEEYFVVGGGEIYALLLPYTNKLYLTTVHEIFDADTFFPEINLNDWEEICLNKDEVIDCSHSSSFRILLRKGVKNK